MWVWSLSQEDTLENGMATHSRILAWRITWTEEPGRLYKSIGLWSWTWLKHLSMHAQIYCFLFWTFLVKMAVGSMWLFLVTCFETFQPMIPFYVFKHQWVTPRTQIFAEMGTGASTVGQTLMGTSGSLVPLILCNWPKGGYYYCAHFKDE